MLIRSTVGALCALAVVSASAVTLAGPAQAAAAPAFVELPPFAEPWVAATPAVRSAQEAPDVAARHAAAAADTDTEVASQPPFEGQLRPACSGPVVTVFEGTYPRCDVAPPQRLDVRLNPALHASFAAMRAACDQMGGGDLTWSEPDLVCEGVDY